MSNRANVSRLQDGPTAGQGQAEQVKNSSADPKDGQEDGGEVLQAVEQSPLQPVVQPTVRQDVPCSPQSPCGADTHLQPTEDPMLE